jgi:hypothetical protein
MSDNPASADHDRFKASIEGTDPKYREELDMDALSALKDDELRAAEELLIERVKTEADWRVPPALATLNVKRAVRPMKERLPKAKGRMRLALARALVALGALPRLDETVIAMLEGGDPDEGISALAAADDLSSPELTKALGHASVHHPGPEVRVNAGAALIQQARLTSDPLAWKFRPLYLVLGEEEMALRLEAFAHICELTKLPMEIAD